MTLVYKFSSEDDYGYEKDLSESDIAEYLNSLEKDDLASLVRDVFYLLRKDEQHSILTDLEEPNFACPDFKRWAEEEMDLCIELMMDDIYQLEDEMHDYFEDEAYKEWRSQGSNDPYKEIGMKPSDF
jgi:hypothetical protein